MAKKTDKGSTEEQKRYEAVRDEAILAFNRIYKNTLAFDLARIGKEDRLRLLEDPVYIAETSAIKADLYARQLKVLNDAIKGDYSDPDKSSANEILKALEMRNKLLFNDLDIEGDESDALNIVFMGMTREDFKNMETAEAFLASSPQGNDDLSFEVEE